MADVADNASAATASNPSTFLIDFLLIERVILDPGTETFHSDGSAPRRSGNGADDGDAAETPQKASAIRQRVARGEGWSP
jgi:hypothetical protein